MIRVFSSRVSVIYPDHTLLADILRTIQTAEDTYVYDRVVSTIFDEERFTLKAHRHHGGRGKVTDESSFIQYTELDTELRDHAIEIAREVFRQHGAVRIEIAPMRILDDYQHFNRFVFYSAYTMIIVKFIFFLAADLASLNPKLTNCFDLF